jgi:hypothetical protein
MKEVSDKELDRILSSIHASRNDLVLESNIHTIGTNYTETNYKPIEYTKIQKVELSAQQANRGKKAIYYCKLPGFSIAEVKHNLISSPHGSYAQFKDIDFSEEKIGEIFEILRQTGLIRPLSVLDEKEIKYCINNESLRELIQKIWEIHQLELAVLQNKWNHFEEPNEVQKEWLLHIFGEKRSDSIINKSYWNRKSFNKIKNEEEISRVKQEIEILEKAITQRVQKLNKKYEKVIQEYAFPPDVLERVCFRTIFNQ